MDIQMPEKAVLKRQQKSASWLMKGKETSLL
jgi:hypothetical protein